MLDGNATVIPVGRNAPVDPYAVLKKFRTSSQAACAVLTPMLMAATAASKIRPKVMKAS
jgi:hypothetical protein